MKRKGLKIEMKITERQIKQLDNFFPEKAHLLYSFLSPLPPMNLYKTCALLCDFWKANLSLEKKVFIMQAVAQHAINSIATANDNHWYYRLRTTYHCFLRRLEGKKLIRYSLLFLLDVIIFKFYQSIFIMIWNKAHFRIKN